MTTQSFNREFAARIVNMFWILVALTVLAAAAKLGGVLPLDWLFVTAPVLVPAILIGLICVAAIISAIGIAIGCCLCLALVFIFD